MTATAMSFGEFRGRWLDQIFDDAKLMPADQCVMYAVARCLNRKAKERAISVSNKSLADSSHRDLSSVKRAIANAVRRGHLEISTKGRTRKLVLKLRDGEAHNEPVEAHNEPLEAHNEPLEAQSDSVSSITTEESKPDSLFLTLSFNPHSDSLAPAAPSDAVHELWTEGVLILKSLGVKEREARSVIGKWLKTTGDNHQAVLDAIRLARAKQTRDPISLITAALSTTAKTRAPRPDEWADGVVKSIGRRAARHRTDDGNVIDVDFAVMGGTR
jgi:hypothetical protein